jgi:large subunit ribosomal protein L9
MKVLLLDNIENIGKRGEVKEVKNGLARNFLLPKKLALRATEHNIKAWENRLNSLKLKDTKIVEDAQAIADTLNAVAVSITVKAGEDDKLFGSVTNEVDRKTILLSEPIKALGSFDVPIKLHLEVTAQIKVDVVKEEE